MPPIEKEPKNPLPKDFVPEGGNRYPVSTGQTWGSVAQLHNVDVQQLIHFNFHTNNPDEVNWYLRRNVGCKVPSHDGNNWTFSSGLTPGVIYIPTNTKDMSPFRVQGRSTVSPIAAEYNGFASPVDYVGRFFDISGAVDTGLAIFAKSIALDAFMMPIGIAGAFAGPMLTVGGAHEAALNVLRTNERKEGLSLGIVLAADKKMETDMPFVRSFIKLYPVRNINYPDYGKQFQGIYNEAFKAGLGHGLQFNTVAQSNLFADIRNKMTNYAREEYDPHYEDKSSPLYFMNWSQKKWEHYYRLCAAIYAAHHLKER